MEKINNKINFLVFDFGASNGRSIAAQYNGHKLNMDILHRFENRPVSMSGSLYWDILRLFSELKIGLTIANKNYKSFISLGIDTWGVDFGFLDKNGKLISNPLNYRDKEKFSYAEKLFEIFSAEELYKKTGGSLSPVASIFSLNYLKLINSVEILNSQSFLMIPDLFNYFLTGESFNEFTNASTTSMLSQVDKNWEKEIIKKLRINPKIFCEIIKPGTEISKINSQLKSELDIKDMKVVAPATHDTASAIAGIPIKEFSKKWAYISMGTWCILGFECENTIINADAMKKGFFNEGGAEGKNLYNKNIVGLWTIQQCMERWIKEKNEHFQWSDLDKIFPFCKEFNSFIDIEDPIFILPNSNMPKTIVDYCKDNNLNIPNNIGEIARCFYESLVFKFRYYFEYLQKFIDEKIEILYMVGEGTKNNYLCQWCSNLNKIPVVASPTQTTAMGNALMQLKSCGEINNLEEGRLISYNSLETAYYTPEDIEKWEEGYQKYLNFLKQ